MGSKHVALSAKRQNADMQRMSLGGCEKQFAIWFDHALFKVTFLYQGVLACQHMNQVVGFQRFPIDGNIPSYFLLS